MLHSRTDVKVGSYIEQINNSHLHRNTEGTSSVLTLLYLWTISGAGNRSAPSMVPHIDIRLGRVEVQMLNLLYLVSHIPSLPFVQFVNLSGQSNEGFPVG